MSDAKRRIHSSNNNDDQDVAAMAAFLKRYSEAIKRKSEDKKKPELKKIDEWMNSTLSKELREIRKPSYLTGEDLSQLMKWKLSRGKFRPRLQQLAESNPDDLVRAKSTEAFKKLAKGKLKEAIETMSELKGVGPATASLILSIQSPESAPFMSDEATEAILGLGKIDYNLSTYLRFADGVKETAERWRRESEDSWSLADVERSLWSRSVLEGPEKAGTKLTDGAENGTDGKKWKN